MASEERCTATPDDELDRLVEENRVLGTLPAAARRQLRESLEPLSVPGGTLVIRKVDPADCLYIVAAGRLRVVTTNPDGEDVWLAEVGRGDVVGEMALITNRPRTATVFAFRDTQLLRLSTEAFTQFVADHPESMRLISTEMVDRLLLPQVVGRPSTPVVTIALLPLGPNPRSASSASASSVHSPASPDRRVESTPATRPGRSASSPRVPARALVQRPRGGQRGRGLPRGTRTHDVDPRLRAPGGPAAPRGRRDDAPAGARLERFANASREVAQSRTELVLVHPAWTEDPRAPRSGSRRARLHRHHHVRVDRPADADRVARLVLSRGVGVVYSGGGARGSRSSASSARCAKPACRSMSRAARASARSSRAQPSTRWTSTRRRSGCGRRSSTASRP